MSLFKITLLFGFIAPLAAQDVPTAPAVAPASPAPAVPALPVASPQLVVITPVASRYDAAMALFNQNKFVEAIPVLSAFIRDFPQSNRREEILYRLGESYRALGRSTDALAAFTYQVEGYPDGPFCANAQLRRGQIQLEAQQIPAAIQALTYVAAKAQGDIQQAGKYLLAKALLADKGATVLDSEKQARIYLGELMRAQPPGAFAAPAALVLAERDDQQGQSAAALAEWQTAAALSTDATVQAIALARAGWSALALNQLDIAERLFQQARSFPVTGDAHKIANTGLLRVLGQKKDYAGWLTVYGREQGQTLDNAKEEIALTLSQAHFALKHWAEAVPALEAYLQSYPKSPSVPLVAYQDFLARSHVHPEELAGSATAYLKSWPDSPYRSQVQLLLAQELSRTGKFSEALPIWQTLQEISTKPEGAKLPRLSILLEVARAYDSLRQYAPAATAYQAYLDAAEGNAKPPSPSQLLQIQARLAVCYQNSNQGLAAENAWKVVQVNAPAGSSEEEMALEALGLIYVKGGPPREAAATATFQKILDQFPQSTLRPLAAFMVGNAFFKAGKYAECAPLLSLARQLDPTAWLQPATQRLVLAAYARKDAAQTESYLQEYQSLPPLSDLQAAVAARIPAAVPYWLAEEARMASHWAEAEKYYRQVTQDPDPGQLLGNAWWQLGEVQKAQAHWADAVTSYETFRKLKPESKDATTVLLALGTAQLGAQAYPEAKALAEQALLQEPEGANSAQARSLLGDVAMAQKNYAEAARQFATLAVLFDTPKTAPKAMAQAAHAYELAGDMNAALEWRQKLKAKYPQYTEQ